MSEIKEMYVFDRYDWECDYELSYEWFLNEMGNVWADEIDWVTEDYDHPTLFAYPVVKWEEDCKNWINKTYGLTEKDDAFYDRVHDYVEGKHYLEDGWTVNGIFDFEAYGDEVETCEGRFYPIDYVA